MQEDTRTCRTCRQDKAPEFFYWRDRAHTARQTECKACVQERSRRRQARLHPPKPPVVPSGRTATCTHCSSLLPEEAFGSTLNPARMTGQCKPCLKARKLKRRDDPSFVPRAQRYNNPDGSRTCRLCGVAKQLSDFGIRDRDRGTRRNECGPCLRELGREKYAADPWKFRETMRRANFGLQPGEYQSMLDDQGGVCAICGGTETGVNPKTGKLRGLFVDHCHRTGVVRQLLCQHCNFGLGNFRDNPELMERAASYIRRFAA